MTVFPRLAYCAALLAALPALADAVKARIEALRAEQLERRPDERQRRAELGLTLCQGALLQGQHRKGTGKRQEHQQ